MIQARYFLKSLQNQQLFTALTCKWHLEMLQMQNHLTHPNQNTLCLISKENATIARMNQAPDTFVAKSKTDRTTSSLDVASERLYHKHLHTGTKPETKSTRNTLITWRSKRWRTSIACWRGKFGEPPKLDTGPNLHLFSVSNNERTASREAKGGQRRKQGSSITRSTSSTPSLNCGTQETAVVSRDRSRSKRNERGRRAPTTEAFLLC